MSNRLVLSIFPGIDLLGRAFEEEGYCIVRGPDVLWGGDIRGWHPPAGVFEGVIGGPPCQSFSRMTNGRQPRHENLIPEFERVVSEAQPTWFLMENVRGAPLASVPSFTTKLLVLDSRWIGEEQRRRRHFCFGSKSGADLNEHIQVSLFENPHIESTVLAGHDDSRQQRETEGRRSLARLAELQGLRPDFLDGAPFTVWGKREVLGNAVPMAMGRAVAHAVRRATESSA